MVEIKLGWEINEPYISIRALRHKHLKRTCDCGDIRWIRVRAMWMAPAMSHQNCNNCKVKNNNPRIR